MSATILFHQLFAIKLKDCVHFAILRPHQDRFKTLCGREMQTKETGLAVKIHGNGTCFNCSFEAALKHLDEPVKRWVPRDRKYDKVTGEIL